MKKIIILALFIMGCQPCFGTVSNGETIRQSFSCNGSTTEFTFTFKCNSSDDVFVYAPLTTTGDPETALTIDVDYTIASTGGSYLNGGVVTISPALASTFTVKIVRRIKQSQELISGAVTHITIELALDKLTRQVQDAEDRKKRSLHIPESDSTSFDMEIPNAVDRAGKFLTFDSNGNPLAADGTTGVEVSAYAATYLDDPSEATFKATTNLEAGTDFHAYTTNGNTILTDAGVLSIAGLTTLTDRMIYTTASDTYAVTTLTASGRALIDDASAATQRTTLGLAIGSDVHAYTANGNTILTDAGVLSIAGLTTAANEMIYTDGSDSYVVTDLTAYSRTLFDDASAAAWRVTLGVTTATDAIDKDGSTVYTGTGAGFKDEDDMSSDSATATASQQSIKVYVDAVSVLLPSSLSGANESLGETTIGELEIKWGHKSFTATQELAIDITDEGLTDFSNACFQVYCSFGDNSIGDAPSAYSPTKTGFTMRNGDNETRVLRWLAIGR